MKFKLTLIILVTLFLTSCDLEQERKNHEFINKSFRCMWIGDCK